MMSRISEYSIPYGRIHGVFVSRLGFAHPFPPQAVARGTDFLCHRDMLKGFRQPEARHVPVNTLVPARMRYVSCQMPTAPSSPIAL